HDLSQPDTVAILPLIGYSIPINIIPLCMAVTQIWLMAMTPKTGDATQRRVMMFTPLIFLFICYNFAAALALYYTTQNLFSIVQFYYNKRQRPPTFMKRAAGKGKRIRRKNYSTRFWVIPPLSCIFEKRRTRTTIWSCKNTRKKAAP